jgi:hypothetical protein
VKNVANFLPIKSPCEISGISRYYYGEISRNKLLFHINFVFREIKNRLSYRYPPFFQVNTARFIICIHSLSSCFIFLLQFHVSNLASDLDSVKVCVLCNVQYIFQNLYCSLTFLMLF